MGTPSPGRHGPPGPGRAPAGPGSVGTIIAISGSTLTLRTMNGTETVYTSSSTTYTKEMEKISFSDLAVNDVVQVAGVPVAAGSSGGEPSSSTRPEPGTGKLDARAVDVIEPTFVGRVLSDDGGAFILVGPEGQLLHVSTSADTRYYKGTTRASASAISDGSHVMAEGERTGPSSLDAQVIMLAPAPPAAAPPMPPPAPHGASSTSSPEA